MCKETERKSVKVKGMEERRLVREGRGTSWRRRRRRLGLRKEIVRKGHGIVDR